MLIQIPEFFELKNHQTPPQHDGFRKVCPFLNQMSWCVYFINGKVVFYLLDQTNKQHRFVPWRVFRFLGPYCISMSDLAEMKVSSDRSATTRHVCLSAVCQSLLMFCQPFVIVRRGSTSLVNSQIIVLEVTGNDRWESHLRTILEKAWTTTQPSLNKCQLVTKLVSCKEWFERDSALSGSLERRLVLSPPRPSNEMRKHVFVGLSYFSRSFLSACGRQELPVARHRINPNNAASFR